MESILTLTIVVIVCSCTLTNDVTLNQQWNLWKDMHKKDYSHVEENHRYKLLFFIFIIIILIIKF